MSDKKCTDQYGTEIAPGDLVVSGGTVGIVRTINAHNAPTIRVRSKRKVCAYEWGVPEVEKTGKRAKIVDGRYVRSDVPGQYYVYEDYTYMDKDRTVVGETDRFYDIIRQRTYDVTVLRKADGTIPARFLDDIEFHKKIFPDKQVDEA